MDWTDKLSQNNMNPIIRIHPSFIRQRWQWKSNATVYYQAKWVFNLIFLFPILWRYTINLCRGRLKFTPHSTAYQYIYIYKYAFIMKKKVWVNAPICFLFYSYVLVALSCHRNYAHTQHLEDGCSSCTFSILFSCNSYLQTAHIDREKTIRCCSVAMKRITRLISKSPVKK